MAHLPPDYEAIATAGRVRIEIGEQWLARGDGRPRPAGAEVGRGRVGQAMRPHLNGLDRIMLRQLRMSSTHKIGDNCQVIRRKMSETDKYSSGRCEGMRVWDCAVGGRL